MLQQSVMSETKFEWQKKSITGRYLEEKYIRECEQLDFLMQMASVDRQTHNMEMEHHRRNAFPERTPETVHCACCRPRYTEDSYNESRYQYPRLYSVPSNFSSYPHEENTPARRVPVITKNFRHHSESSSSTQRRFSSDDDVFQHYPGSGSETDNRRSVSPIYSPPCSNTSLQEHILSEYKTPCHNVYKTEPNRILLCEESQDAQKVNWKDIPSPGYISPDRFLFPSNLSHYMPYPTDYSNSNLSRGIRKRQRTIFTPSQLKQLEEKFKECSFIVGEDRSLLATKLKLKEQQVKIWFQNRRTKCKQEIAQKSMDPKETEISRS